VQGLLGWASHHSRCGLGCFCLTVHPWRFKLPAQVVQLKRRAGSYAEALAAYKDGNISGCLDLLLGQRDFQASSLRARAYNRLGRPASALQEMAVIDNPASHLRRGEQAVIRMSALNKLRRFEEATAISGDVRPYIFGAVCAPLEAEFEFYVALLHFSQRDTQAASEAAVRVFEVDSSPFERNDYFAPLVVTQALALELLGLIEARRERYAGQAAHLRDALQVLERSRVRDSYVFVSLLANLSFIVRDLDFESDAQYVRSQLPNILWNQDLESKRFHILRSLGWCSALRGDHLAAFRDFRQASESTATIPLKILAALDRVQLSRELHEGGLANDELATAEDLSLRVDWEMVMSEDRTVLLALSREVAAVSPARARRAYDRYCSIKSKLSPQFLADSDRRSRADQAVAHASVLRSEGEVNRATLLLEEAFQIYDQVGYRWRAAGVAIELAQLTSHERYLNYAQAEASARPHSWMARRVFSLELGELVSA
jgi:tetratricopeptide (TPR) repeat protein